MAYAKFDCKCGCGEKVQYEGGFRRGHRHAAADAARAMQEAMVAKLTELFTPEDEQTHLDQTAEPVVGVQKVEVRNEDYAPPVIEPAQAVSSGLDQGPPAYPASIDRRRWRLASERPGTPPTNPWIQTKCHVCLGPMWTRDPTSTWEYGGICEEDEYILRSEMSTHGRQQFQSQARTYIDPFRPR